MGQIERWRRRARRHGGAAVALWAVATAARYGIVAPLIVALLLVQRGCLALLRGLGGARRRMIALADGRLAVAEPWRDDDDAADAPSATPAAPLPRPPRSPSRWLTDLDH